MPQSAKRSSETLMEMEIILNHVLKSPPYVKKIKKLDWMKRTRHRDKMRNKTEERKNNKG